MAKKIEVKRYEDAVEWLRKNGFEISSDGANRVTAKKSGCSATFERDASNGGSRLAVKPGYLIGGELSRLVDKGYQKFLKTSKLEVPATAEHLHAIHSFSEELREGMGATSLYNEALGTVSDRYVYDRVKDRETAAKPKRPWDKLLGKTGA